MTPELSTLRHDLRTPLNQMLGYSEMLLEETQGQPAVTQALEEILSGSKRILSLVSQVLAVEMASPHSIRSVLQGPLQEVRARTEQLLAEARESGWEHLLGDLQKIATAAGNLDTLLNDLESETAKPAALDSVFSFESVANSPAKPARITPGRILVVDDAEMNRDMLSRRLEREGHKVTCVENGREALARMEQADFDLVLLDIIMPEMDGFTVLKRMKADARLRELPVILISGLEDVESIARCIEIGADDYLPKPFKPVLLRARIGSCLERKQLREQEQATHRALVESQKHLAEELAEAEKYVRSLLPEPLTGKVQTEWRFITSTSLGGDSFGYYWLDDEHLAMYLLDVCGHGVGAALLSISAMNVLRSQALPGTDFKDPGAVLIGLNEAFQMDRQNNMYFTIWYGVYNAVKRQIVFARGGHPPAILLTGTTRETAQPVELKTPGMVIGSMPGLKYRTATADLGAFSQLYLFSDGVYEVALADGTMWEFNDFVTSLIRPAPPGESELDRVMSVARGLQGRDTFDDDFSLVKFVFP